MCCAQRPYVVLGSLRDNMLYPTWADPGAATDGSSGANGAESPSDSGGGQDAQPSLHMAAATGASSNGAQASANGSAPSTAAGAVSLVHDRSALDISSWRV